MWANDIALIKLKDKVPSGADTPQIQAVALPPQGEMRFPPDGARCIMKGWGCQVGGTYEFLNLIFPNKSLESNFLFLIYLITKLFIPGGKSRNLFPVQHFSDLFPSK